MTHNNKNANGYKYVDAVESAQPVNTTIKEEIQMFNVDMKWCGPLIVRAVEALEAIAESSREIALTAKAQRAILQPWPDSNGTAHNHPAPPQTPISLVSDRATMLARGKRRAGDRG